MTTNTPELKQIKGMVEDMEVIESLLGNKGRFVGDMVHISIKDLAGCIRADLAEKPAIDDAEVREAVERCKAECIEIRKLFPHNTTGKGIGGGGFKLLDVETLIRAAQSQNKNMNYNDGYNDAIASLKRQADFSEILIGVLDMLHTGGGESEVSYEDWARNLAGDALEEHRKAQNKNGEKE